MDSQKQQLLDQLRSSIAAVEAGASANSFSGTHVFDKSARNQNECIEEEAILPSGETSSFLPSKQSHNPKKTKNRKYSGFSSSIEQQDLSFNEYVEVAEDLEPEKKELTADEAFKRIVYLLKPRDRSVFETKQRLRKLGFSDSIIDEAIDRALRCGYLDDERFGELFLRSRINQGKGLKGAIADLQRKHHIKASDLESYSSLLSSIEETEDARALELLRKRSPRSKNKYQGAYAKLIRAGFSSSTAHSATKKWLAELGQ